MSIALHHDSDDITSKFDGGDAVDVHPYTSLSQSNPDSILEIIQQAEMEKHVHGPLQDEESIRSMDQTTLNGDKHTGTAMMIANDQLAKSHNHQHSQLESPSSLMDMEAFAATKTARMIRETEMEKHAHGLKEDEISIKAMDAASLHEGRRETMIRKTEMKKHAHGLLQDESSIKAVEAVDEYLSA